MAVQSRELLKLTAGAMVASAALRLIWKNFIAAEEINKIQTLSKSPTASSFGKRAGSQEGQAVEEGVWIYFASQSGTAEVFAKDIEEELAKKRIPATVVDLEDFDPDVFCEHKTVVMVIATYGEGDPTDNSVDFFRWLQNASLPETNLEDMRFTVMGLGNRQYVNFNVCSQVTDERMEALGAQRIYDRGVGDDDQNIEEDFEQWKENGLWPAIIAATGMELPSDAQLDQPSSNDLTAQRIVAELQLQAEVVAAGEKTTVDALVLAGGTDVLGKWYFQAHEVPVRAERELRQEADSLAGSSSKHLDLDVSSAPSLDWKTADNLEILPSNTRETVEWFATRLGVYEQLDHILAFIRASGVDRPVKKPFPTPCLVRDSLALYCDLCQVPPKHALKKLAAMATDEADRELVEALINDRPTFQWLTGPDVRLSFQEFLEIFLPSLQIDLSTFLQICPRQKSRAYTIASSSREDAHTIGVCVSILSDRLRPIAAVLAELADKGHQMPGAAKYLQRIGEAKAREGRTLSGLCSSMLCGQVSAGSKLFVAARSSSFRLPRQSTAPVIMVGAGTGIAPFRGFVREFHTEAGRRENTMLFFGCTKEHGDFLYKEELLEASQPQADKVQVLGQLITAFSREQKEKIYVQHRLRERGAEVKALMGEGGHLYVCGAVAMGAAIREILGEIMGSTDHVSRLCAEGRYVEELW